MKNKDAPEVPKDFFISYARPNRGWAEWVAWQLEEANYSTIIQAWDFPPGVNFMAKMDVALRGARYVIAIFSPAYFGSPYTEAEWTSAYDRNALIPVEIEDSRLYRTGILIATVCIDLKGLDEEQACARLLPEVRSRVSSVRARPNLPPIFPPQQDRQSDKEFNTRLASMPEYGRLKPTISPIFPLRDIWSDEGVSGQHIKSLLIDQRWAAAESSALSIYDRNTRSRICYKLVVALSETLQWTRAEAIAHSIENTDYKLLALEALFQALLEVRETSRANALWQEISRIKAASQEISKIRPLPNNIQSFPRTSRRSAAYPIVVGTIVAILAFVSLFGIFAHNTLQSQKAKHPTAIATSPSISHKELVWTSNTTTGVTGIGKTSLVSSPAIANGLVYVGSYDGRLYAFDATTGKSRWVSTPTGDVVTSSPVVKYGIVYVGSWDHKLYAFNAFTGKTLWISAPTGNSIFSSPAIDGRVVYVGSQDGKLYAFDALTGHTLWVSAPTGGAIESSPVVANGIVYVGSWDHKLYAYKASECSNSQLSCPPLWASAPTGGLIKSSPAIANGIVYIGSDDGKLYAYQASNCGKGQLSCPPLWISAPTGNRVSSSPAIDSGIVYIGSDDGKLYAFAANTGKTLWVSAPTGGAFYTSSIVDRGILYASLNNGTIYVYNTAECLKSTQCQPASTLITPTNATLSSPKIVNGEIYVSTQNGKLYAFH